MQLLRKERQAVARTTVAVVIIVVIVVAGIAAYFATQSATSSSSTTVSSSQTTTSSSSTTVSSSLTTTSSSSAPLANTLSIDDIYWPIDDLNQLYAVYTLPYPDWLEYTVYQPLVTANVSAEYGQGVFQYVPVLAKNFTVSGDGTVYTFNLRPGVHFSNGDLLNAYQVWAEMYGFYYLSGNSSAWCEGYDLFNMANSDFGPATLSLLNQSGVIHPSSQLLSIMQNSTWPIFANGPNQIVFHLTIPFQWFPSILLATVGLIFDVQYVLDNGGFGTPTGFNSNFNQHPIPGTGPYVVTTVSENAYVEFTQSNDYWGKNLSSSEIAANPLIDPGHAKNVIVYNKPDDLSRYTDLASGKAQISSIESTDWNLVLANQNEFSYFTSSFAPVTGAISFNTQIFPTNITAVREAIVHAINYTDISQKVFFGQTTPFMGPEYPAWKEFYDLGNYPPYQFNLTLAEQYLAEANIKNFPTLTFTVEADCLTCSEVAQIVQSDLTSLNINVNILVLGTTSYIVPYGSYGYEVQNAAQIGHMSILGGISAWVPSDLTPAEYWLQFVSNESVFGNWAVYSNPTVQQCANSFTDGSSTSTILTLCTAAQKQIYNDAPYAWYGIEKLWYGGGSLVWQKSVIKGFYTDPVWGGYSDVPMFNTVTYVSGS